LKRGREKDREHARTLEMRSSGEVGDFSTLRLSLEKKARNQKGERETPTEERKKRRSKFRHFTKEVK